MKELNLDSYLVKLNKLLWENVDNSDIINTFVFGMDDIIEDFYIPSSLNDLYSLYKDVFDISFNNKFIKLNELDYISNPYNLNIHPKEFSNSIYKLSYKSFNPYYPILIGDVKVKDNKEIINLGYFESITKYSYLSITKDEWIWMEITPHEILTMQDSLNKIEKEVVIYGLGLGYYAYMALLNPKVTKVTVIENDIEIINIFNNYIYPYFKINKPFNIIHTNALEYNIDSSTSFTFIDLWHDASDGLMLYLKLKQKEKDNIIYHYWIEDSLIQLIRRYIIAIITKDSNIEINEEYKYIQNLIKDIQIESKEDIDKLLSKDNILYLIKNKGA